MNYYPGIDDALPQMEIVEKPETKGFVATVVFWVCRNIIGKFAPDWLDKFENRYMQALAGRIYTIPGVPVTDSLLLHERVHGWQEAELGTLRYYWRYALKPRSGRLELEAQAYASEVVAGYRKQERAVYALSSGIYFPEPWGKVDEARATEAVERHIEGWKDAGFDQDAIRALGKR